MNAELHDPKTIEIGPTFDPNAVDRYLVFGRYAVKIPGSLVATTAALLEDTSSQRPVRVSFSGDLSGPRSTNNVDKLEWAQIPANTPVVFTRSLPRGVVLLTPS